MEEKEDFLSRWSRRKHESEAAAAGELQAPSPPPPPAGVTSMPAAPETKAPLPSIESLTPESDFVPFMKPDVDEGLKRRALQALFRDPHFNKMDMLDIYVGDYSQPDPLPEGWLAKLRQMDRLGHYQPPEETAGESQPQETLEASGSTENLAPEQEVGSPPSDTADAVDEAPKMGESAGRRPPPT
jgi:Protein of unknown function (DUF3306)